MPLCETTFGQQWSCSMPTQFYETDQLIDTRNDGAVGIRDMASLRALESDSRSMHMRSTEPPSRGGYAVPSCSKTTTVSPAERYVPSWLVWAAWVRPERLMV